MKTVVFLETAAEILNAFQSIRHEGDINPHIPRDVYLVSDAEGLHLSGKENIGIAIGNVSWDELCEEALNRLGVRFHIT